MFMRPMDELETAEMTPDLLRPAASDGFETFFEVSFEGLLRALYLVTGDREEAGDLAQDAFLRVWQHWDRVQTMESPEGYLYRTAMNLWRNRLRSAAHAARRAMSRQEARDPFSDADDRDQVIRALRALTPRQRAALALVDLMEFTSEEAGQMLGIRASTVRALATQGRTELRVRKESKDE